MREKTAKIYPPSKAWAIVRVLAIIGSVLILLIATLFLFQVRAIEVVGVRNTSKNDVIDWVTADRLASNSLLMWLRHNDRTEGLPPGIEMVQVGFNSLWEIELRVTEKKMIGYIEYNNYKVYFDGGGIASVITQRDIPEAIPVVGINDLEEEVMLGEQLFLGEGVIDNVVEVITSTAELNLKPCKLSVSGRSITLYFENVTVRLGSGFFEDRILQIPPILDKLAFYYPGVGGVLHLERFERSGNLVRFVPDNLEDYIEDEDELDQYEYGGYGYNHWYGEGSYENNYWNNYNWYGDYTPNVYDWYQEYNWYGDDWNTGYYGEGYY